MKAHYLFFVIFIFLAACHGQPIEMEIPIHADEGYEQTEVNNDERIQLEVWSYYHDGWEETFQDYQEEHPNIEFSITTFEYDDYYEAYFNAIATGDVPDIMVIDSPYLASFKSMDGFENLLDEPYLAGQHKHNFPEALWEVSLSLDGESLLAMPFNTSPLVTYYRADIMEDYGFPSEPDELAEYMEEPENWFLIGETLRRDDKWILQWPIEVIRLYESTRGFYNNEMKLVRDDGEFIQAVNHAQHVKDNGMFPGLDIYGWNGREAIRNDEYVMIYLGTWGADYIKQIAPEQEGKWRVTRLPFNLYGWTNSVNLAIPEASTNKLAAWDFVEYYTTERMMGGLIDSVPAYIPARGNEEVLSFENPFFGGQLTQQLYEDMMSKTEESFLTPLDFKTQHIWDNTIYDALELGLRPRQILDALTENIEYELAEDMEILRGSVTK
ncbi:ABC transporter substrate-binding protein [Evansella cellulosilytica]|uniref:Extracellular solute-binding protein family 1 n=1 Tax=Evansella cellulosilytica (strain ATCC 21833 / DSM 2522 / FERM P-1141 / JCM 9156 / N-4) TaxID=649639 RepID=E6TZ15_EVAC2|nr:extracellular solute-binding protein [Evansella cellulosilytica]ADU32458.1 extracellular solute-binding protein family 1 [Evansella cellulosilytica DSM 2522]